MTGNMSRRRLLGAAGVTGLATAAGSTGGLVIASGVDGDQNQGGSPAGTPEVSTSADVPEALANPIVQTLGAIDFQPANAAAAMAYDYVVPGGVQVTAGQAWFNAGLRLPVGATIIGAAVFLNPNGASRAVMIERYNPLVPSFQPIASATSSNGTAPERVALTVNHTIAAGFNYRFDNISLTPGGLILYGAEITYTLPPDPSTAPGGFVPFAGANPRVYDSRSGAPKLAPNEERTIALGVPGTARAAVFNLTVTQTEEDGFVSAFRADIAFPGNSSVNWTTPNNDVANLVVCAVDPTGAIKLRGGNASTHVIVDLVGHFV